MTEATYNRKTKVANHRYPFPVIDSLIQSKQDVVRSSYIPKTVRDKFRITTDSKGRIVIKKKIQFG
jgi:hypothetical protein